MAGSAVKIKGHPTICDKCQRNVICECANPQRHIKLEGRATMTLCDPCYEVVDAEIVAKLGKYTNPDPEWIRNPPRRLPVIPARGNVKE